MSIADGTRATAAVDVLRSCIKRKDTIGAVEALAIIADERLWTMFVDDSGAPIDSLAAFVRETINDNGATSAGLDLDWLKRTAQAP